MLQLCLSLALLVSSVTAAADSLTVQEDEYTGNINGVYSVFTNMHYANKSSVIWGENGQQSISVMVSFSESCGLYNCSNNCDDPDWYGDFNKLWGKARCGYVHDHHQDSDRFTWRRCTADMCAGYTDADGSKIQIAAYSYDGGVAPYTGENPELLKIFTTILSPNIDYLLTLTMDATGLSVFKLSSSTGTAIETQTVQHSVLCEDNYYEGVVQGLYFGGTCRAPEDVTVHYTSSQ